MCSHVLATRGTGDLNVFYVLHVGNFAISHIHWFILASLLLVVHCMYIRESVDSLCRDGADAQYMQYLKHKQYNFTTNALNGYLSAQASSSSAFVISKTQIVAQKLRGRQLNAEVYGSTSVIFHILFLFRPLVKRR